MILFYSEYCNHCKVLLETIQRHDKNNIIKTVSIDLLRSLQLPIDNRIQSVPALYFIKSKEILFGKSVFDHLLLPNRGVLFSDNNTRIEKGTKDVKEINNNSDKNVEISSDTTEPQAFSLGLTNFSDNFSSLDDKSTNILSDKTYTWDTIECNDEKINNNITDSINPISSSHEKTDKKLPSLEELMTLRNKDIY